MNTFQTLDVSNEGNRGRPPHPRVRERQHEAVMNAKGVELGEMILEPQADGSVALTVIANGKKKVVTFPAVKPKARKAKAKAE